ncbi:MAG: hypothetical protein JSW67_13225 [Candidatus Latescibacterota bacterium]|nr:MAG: hypothetical protein JSW67_13225 [Candidatus Latescibacterota bacterium]
MSSDRKDLIAQWVYDARAVLGRFHVWLEDVEETWPRGEPEVTLPFVGASLERSLMVATAITALGTRLFGRFGEGRGAEKAEVNRVKKEADAISAYAMSEALWYLSRGLPENHAIMVSLGEGLMPKAGETPEMGSNPLLGFGRVYARAEVAKFVGSRVRRLINVESYKWEQFWDEVNRAGITIWGAAVDTLENTSRFAKGAQTGPMCVLHLFDQPLNVALPYEGYMGSLCLPTSVIEAAGRRSVLANYLTPRAKIVEAIRDAYPDIEVENIHVWTLGGASRTKRLHRLWEEWRSLGVHVVEDGWTLPNGLKSFTESGTYAPTYLVGVSHDSDGQSHLFLCDGYAASAEAIQAASLDPILDQQTSMCVFSSNFEISHEREQTLMQLDPDAEDFADDLRKVLEREPSDADVTAYRLIIQHAAAAGMPLDKPAFTVDDLFPEKKWRGLALSATMSLDPYSGMPGVEDLGSNIYRVTVRAATRTHIREARLSFRLMETLEESRRVFSPLLDRFYAGESYRDRPVKISDSGRIRNELQTWCSEALEHFAEDGMRVRLDDVEDAVLSAEKKKLVRDVCSWYKQNHPTWFRWLEIV